MFLTRRFYIVAIVVILCIASGFLWSPMFFIGKILLWLFLTAVVVDIVLLSVTGAGSKEQGAKGIYAQRILSDRFSNGDDNEVRLRIENNYPFTVCVEVIDEIPFIFQRRDICFRATVPSREAQTIKYQLRPTRRGSYGFGQIRVFTASPLGLLFRRFTLGEPRDVKVYPSFLMLHQYELLAISNNLTELGIKRIRRVGHHTDFEQIKDYVAGDDFRTINWKASARRSKLMVNVYQDERSQHIYNVIDKGRVMQQAFNGMALLDYAINASLVLSYIAMNKEDRAGLITFNEQFDTFVPASKQQGHLQLIMDTLYAQQTTFGETDYSSLVIHLNKYVNKRSLIVLYTNFTSMVSMKRQLPFLQQINSRHRLLVVFFEDEQLKEYINAYHSSATHHSTESYYRQVMADRFVYEQRLIVSTLRQYGILSLLTTPQNLSVDVINRYLEMKQRQQI